MGRSQTFSGVILRTIDIGEADRMCIVYTKERGRLAMVAKGVRKAGSKLGGMVMPMRILTLQCSVSSHGMIISGATELMTPAWEIDSSDTFLSVMRAFDMLLSLTEEDDPMPEAFALLERFFKGPKPDRWSGVYLQVSLLLLLGILPFTMEDPRVRMLDPESRKVLDAIALGKSLKGMSVNVPALEQFALNIAQGELQRPLRSAQVSF